MIFNKCDQFITKKYNIEILCIPYNESIVVTAKKFGINSVGSMQNLLKHKHRIRLRVLN